MNKQSVEGIFKQRRNYINWLCNERVSYCCLVATQPFFSYIMTRTS